jgi:hypothetical protein
MMNFFSWLLSQYMKGRVKSLILGLQHADPSVRESSVRNMIALGRHAVPHLINYLQDSNQWARLMAVAALGKMQDLTALEPLERALVDPDEGVRSMARTALDELQSYKRNPELPRLIADWRKKEPRCVRCGSTQEDYAKKHQMNSVVGLLVGVCPKCRKAFCRDHYIHSNRHDFFDDEKCPEDRTGLDFSWDDPPSEDKPWRIGRRPR